MLTHVETSPGALYRTDLTQDPTTGQLTATATTNLDLAHLNGLSLPCASSITPWGTHLAGEEYPPDARRWQNAINWTDLPANTKNFARYWGHDVYTDVDEDRIPDNLVWADLRAEFDPYRYGTPFEATVTDDDTVVVRHPSMGRTSVELALVLPDQRTAFITDDESNAVLYLYVADTAGDLSAGTLYAMVWTQTSDDGAGEADLTWISLGHATDAEITAAVDGGVTFSDLFDVSLGLFDPKTGEALYTCPRTLTAVHTSTGFECLRVKDGMAVLASRLETDRYAAMLGATAELRKAEGITYDPDHERVYLAISEIDEGMESHAAAGWDDGGPDHVRLQENICGVVYALDLAPDALVGSDHVPVHASELLSGKPREFRPHLSPYARDDCDATRIANPDNIHYLPGYGVLFVAEDTREQQNDSVWAYDVNDEVLTRIFTTPYEAEATGIYTYTLGDWSYLKVVVHDPYGVRGGQDPETPDDIEGYDGVIGPLPAL